MRLRVRSVLRRATACARWATACVGSRAARLAWGVLCWGVIVGSAPLAAWPTPQNQDPTVPPAQDPPVQNPPIQNPPTQDRDSAEGKPVVELIVEPDAKAELITRVLRTRKGQPLRAAEVEADLALLLAKLKLIARCDIEELGDGVRVFFVIQEERTFDRYEFHGLSTFSDREARTLLGLDVGQRINRMAADQYALTLVERYRRKGHAFVQVRIEEDRTNSVLHFWVDEGPRVKIGRMVFLGNESYPGWIALRFADNLGGSPRLSSEAAGTISSTEYSREVLDEDLDRLRVWYRQRGFRDARVEFVGEAYSADRSVVDLTIRIIEGRRYRIASLDIRFEGDATPRYPKADLLALVKSKVGEPYDFLQIDQDKLAIARFYGERGHPREGQFGRGIENAFQIGDPEERFDIENALVHIALPIREGSPKRLRAVQVRGNTDTQDRIILRKVFQMPGERLDLLQLERSQNVLDSLRYFSDWQGYGGAKFELLPVEGTPDDVDLAVTVTEGDTGSFLWGGGVSTAFGVQARLQFLKRNFDISRLPSSWNPIDWFGEIGSNKAFHGAGQELSLVAMPGTELSFFDISFFEPDLFGTHMDTIGLRVAGYRRLQALDSFRSDTLGGELGLQRAFTEELSVGLSLRDETVNVRDIQASAPAIVYDAEGKTEVRGLSANISFSDVDYPAEPTQGFKVRLGGEYAGGFLGASAEFWKLGINHTQYLRLWKDARDRAHVLRLKSSFDWGGGHGEDEDLFLTERFYMGGNTLRGFDQRRAGPFQFGKPVGGEARVLSSLEYGFPLFSTRQQGQLRETEVLRGHIFADFGMLGLSLNDLGSPRLTYGIGVRVLVPVLEAPLEFDFAWPLLAEDLDQERIFYFSIAR